MTDRRDRALGALYGLAVGDALGMPTQSLPRARVQARYGDLIDGFAAGAPDHPLAAGLPAGSVTDDTEQAVIVGRLVIEGGGTVDPDRLATELLAWEQDMRARGSLDLLGPSTRHALDQILAGHAPGETGRDGTTNGAAMRITPVGIATPASDVSLLTDRVVAASRLTHGTGVALAGAAAVAAAVSAGVDGASVPEATAVAVRAARVAAGRGRWIAAADVPTRITWATGLVRGLPDGQVIDTVYRLVGTSLATQESVPAAFAVAAACADDPWLACRMGASVGGDCDTIAAIAGAICGACLGASSLPAHARARIDDVNHLGLAELADGLLAVRDGRSGSPPESTGAAR